MFHNELMRHAKKHTVVAILLATRFGERGPRAILRCRVELCLMFFFTIQPAGDMFAVARFGERLAEKGLQFSGESHAIEGVGLLFLDAADSLLLDEFSLQSVERRKRVVPLCERGKVPLNTK